MLLDELEADPRFSVPQMRRWHERNRGHPRYALTLAEGIVSGSARLELAGAWLLRRWLKEGGQPTAEAWTIIIDGLDGVRSHLARLTLCQLWVEQPHQMERAVQEVAAFLRRGLDDPKGTVRICSLNALWLLAQRHPEFRPEVSAAVRRAKRDREPCVQARLRRLGLVPYPPKKKPAAR
jgi:hypothetical protein